jgi:hypothetical protein
VAETGFATRKRCVPPVVEVMRNALRTVASDWWLVAGVAAQATSFAKSKRWVSPGAGDEDCRENRLSKPEGATG